MCRLLPGANASAVGFIVSAVLLLSLQIYKESPFPKTSLCIGKPTSIQYAFNPFNIHIPCITSLCNSFSTTGLKDGQHILLAIPREKLQIVEYFLISACRPSLTVSDKDFVQASLASPL